MGAESKIEWTHHTFQPWIGCAEAEFPDGRIHPGCAHCYARDGWGRRFGVTWGKGAQRRLMSEDNWRKPLAWARRAALHGVRERVFCASLADVLDVDAPPAALERLWDLVRATFSVCHACGGRRTTEGLPALGPLGLQRCLGRATCHLGGTGGLDWLLLTKRPERWELVPEDVRPLVWLGTSVSDQATAEHWVPWLLDAKGFRLRFLSVEPLVGPVDLTRLTLMQPQPPHGPGAWLNALTGHVEGPDDMLPDRIDWVIVGGESGHHARPMHPAWARALRDQCTRARVPFFFKQWGEWAPWGECRGEESGRWDSYVNPDGTGGACAISSMDHETWTNWTGTPQEGLAVVSRQGKKAAGRQLDGRTWDELPEVHHG